MGVVINTNIASISASRSLYSTRTDLEQAMERLASGKRINGAKDDAAGMSVVTRMKAQITSLNQAVRNANDGISMLATYDGAADEIEDILIRMRDSDPYIRGMIAWIGFKQIQIFYDRDGRGDGKENTKMNLMSGKVLNYWLDKALISFSDAPLKLTLGLGLFSTILAFVGFIFIVLQKILGFAIPGWSAIMASILFFGGIQMFVIGLAGLYIGNIFRQSKNRPLYVISEIIDG